MAKVEAKIWYDEDDKLYKYQFTIDMPDKKVRVGMIPSKFTNQEQAENMLKDFEAVIKAAENQ